MGWRRRKSQEIKKKKQNNLQLWGPSLSLPWAFKEGLRTRSLTTQDRVSCKDPCGLPLPGALLRLTVSLENGYAELRCISTEHEKTDIFSVRVSYPTFVIQKDIFFH